MNEIKNYGYLDNLDLIEYISFPIYIIVILLISYWIQQKNIKKNPIYKYYTWGVAAKLFGAIVFCLVYIYVYKGGDTISYFESSRALTNLLLDKPADFFKVMSEGPSIENYFLFNGRTTGYPWEYMYYDPKTFMVIKLLVPFLIVSFNSYALSTLLFSYFSFFGIWKMYSVFCKIYPKYSLQLAFSILFLPSAVFWGSGILKDTITLSASCWYIYSFYWLFVAKKERIKNALIIIITSYLILTIKPYILFALLPGSIIWIFYERILGIKNTLIRTSIIPLGLFISVLLGFFILTSVANFNIKDLLNEASVKQNDLKRSEYKGNSFDIGNYEPTVTGALSVSPAAITAGLYRPFLWEAKNMVMFISGLENFIYILVTIMIFWKLRLMKVFRIIFANPLIMFCLIYSVLFALIVGLSTSNFGAMVRFKIAYLPEFVASLLLLYGLVNQKEKNE